MCGTWWWHEKKHCGTHGAWKSYSGLAIYEILYTFVVGKPWLSHPFMRFVSLQLENHTLVIHLCEIFCIPMVEKSYIISYPSYPFTWEILYLCSWKIILKTGGPIKWISWTFSPLSYPSIHQFGNIPYCMDSYPYGWKIIYPCSWKIIWYIIPLQLENNMIYHTSAVGK